MRKTLERFPFTGQFKSFFILNKKHIDKKLISCYLYCQVLTTEWNYGFTNKTSCSALPQTDIATMII